MLCTDKTGTLTEARIHLERHLDALGRESQRVLELAYLNSFFETGLKSPMDDAILEHTEIGVSGWRKIDEVPFDFERRRVSVLVDNGEAGCSWSKGLPRTSCVSRSAMRWTRKRLRVPWTMRRARASMLNLRPSQRRLPCARDCLTAGGDGSYPCRGRATKPNWSLPVSPPFSIRQRRAPRRPWPDLPPIGSRSRS